MNKLWNNCGWVGSYLQKTVKVVCFKQSCGEVGKSWGKVGVKYWLNKAIGDSFPHLHTPYYNY